MTAAGGPSAGLGSLLAPCRRQSAHGALASSRKCSVCMPVCPAFSSRAGYLDTQGEPGNGRERRQAAGSEGAGGSTRPFQDVCSAWYACFGSRCQGLMVAAVSTLKQVSTADGSGLFTAHTSMLLAMRAAWKPSFPSLQ